MSQYTSFVAVDEKDAEEIAKQRAAQPPRRMLVPVPLPEGTEWEGFFGPLGEGQDEVLELAATSNYTAGHKFTIDGLSRYGGLGGLGGGGFGGGVYGGRPMPASQPALRVGYGLPANLSAFRMSHQQAGQAPFPSRAAISADRRYARFTPMPLFSGIGRVSASRPANGKAIVSFEQVAGEVADLNEISIAGGTYTANVLAANTEGLAKAAQQRLEAGRKRSEKKEFGEARADLVRAYFLATAAANRGNHQAAQTAGAAMTELKSLHTDRVQAWKKATPALGTKLDLVLRNMAVGEALDAIAQAATLRIRLLDGSVEDASDMLAGRHVRISYLDLRGATAAQALDWMLQPLRLSWQPEVDRGAANAILVGSDRRMPRISAWVYDVSTIALPSEKEFEEIGDRNKAVAMAKENAEQFVDAVRKALKASEEEVTWFAPGQLLVIGKRETHGQAAEVIAQLSDPEAKPTGSLAALHTKTSGRAQDRRERVQKVRELSRLMETIAVHDEFSWKLLAAALAGQVDEEALTELQIAWRAEETKKLLDGKGASISLRSAWAITAASRMLSGRNEISVLADSVRDGCRPAAEKAVGAIKDTPQDLAAVLAAAYAAMAIGDADLSDRVLAELPDNVTADSPTAGAVFAARGLLGESPRIDSQQLASLIAAGRISGEDITVLFAMACHRAGGETWTTFRAEMSGLLGKQPLPGNVVVLVNRLSGNVPQLARR
jgi:hypothetical protein